MESQLGLIFEAQLKIYNIHEKLNVLLINNSPAPTVFSKDCVVGHLEQTEIDFSLRNT